MNEWKRKLQSSLCPCYSCAHTKTSIPYLWVLVDSKTGKKISLDIVHHATDEDLIRQIFRWFRWKRLMEWKANRNNDWMKKKNNKITKLVWLVPCTNPYACAVHLCAVHALGVFFPLHQRHWFQLHFQPFICFILGVGINLLLLWRFWCLN